MDVFIDFDGVICDAFVECAAVTRAADELSDGQLPPPLTAYADRLPADFLKRFAAVRPLSRTLADFMITNRVGVAPADRDEFEAVKRQISDLDRMTARAQAARDHWRVCERASWLDLHRIEPDVRNWLAALADPVTIVSSKDEESIAEIMKHHGLEPVVGEIVGGCSDKLTAVRERLRSGREAVFIDDSLANVLQLADLVGLNALWATWGYHTPDDVELATSLGVARLDLSDLAELRPGRAVLVGR